MKFSEIDKANWEELAPYLDTCLLPVSVLSGNEFPWEATAALQNLQTLMDHIELPYTGRVVTYPAMHYFPEENPQLQLLEDVCSRLKEKVGFKYVIVVTRDPDWEGRAYGQADLVIGWPGTRFAASGQTLSEYMQEKIETLWRNEE